MYIFSNQHIASTTSALSESKEQRYINWLRVLVRYMHKIRCTLLPNRLLYDVFSYLDAIDLYF